MKAAKTLMGLMFVSLMATSCLSLDGHLDVKQVMSAKKKSGFLNMKTTTVQIKPDLYKAELKINSDKSYTLKLEGHDKISIPLKAKDDLNVPSNGKVSISHDDINQPFDISGDIATDVDNSSQVNTIESCTRTINQRRCVKVCEKPNPCKVECADEQITIDGRQEVTYHVETVRRDISIDFLRVGAKDVLASFKGSDTESSRINDYVGICR